MLYEVITVVLLTIIISIPVFLYIDVISSVSFKSTFVITITGLIFLYSQIAINLSRRRKFGCGSQVETTKIS